MRYPSTPVFDALAKQLGDPFRCSEHMRQQISMNRTLMTFSKLERTLNKMGLLLSDCR